MITGRFPNTRMRRNRLNKNTRALIAENCLLPSDFLQPIFISDQINGTNQIDHFDNIVRYGLNPLVSYVEQIQKLGIPGVMLFSHIDSKDCDESGSYSLRSDGIIPRAVRILRNAFPEMMLIADVALDCYTNHGHDGILTDEGTVDNDRTVEMLCQQALVLAEAGCDSLSPSDMMDGRISAIRNQLDKAGYDQVRLIAYSCKYASCFYDPFRKAVNSKNRLQGNKNDYQINPANVNEAIHEAALDVDEGADMLIIKPGITCLDILSLVKKTFKKPTISYQVSGEYAMLKLAAKEGIVDWNRAIEETMLCFKRAGADAIISYAAVEVVKMLHEQMRY